MQRAESPANPGLLRCLFACPQSLPSVLLSPEWLRVAESLNRIAMVTDMVRHAQGSNPGPQARRDGSLGTRRRLAQSVPVPPPIWPSQERSLPRKAEDATIWETEEAGLRFVLEEGKLAMIVRIAIAHAVWLKSVACGSTAPPAVLSEEQADGLEQLERGALSIVSNAWTHEEAIQTLEPALIVELISAWLSAASAAGAATSVPPTSSVSPAPESPTGASASAGSGGTPDDGSLGAPAAAGAASAAPEAPLPTAQLAWSAAAADGGGALVLRLVLHVGSKLEKLPEGRLLAELLRYGTLAAFCSHLDVNGAALPPASIAEGLRGLSLLLQGEEVGAARDELLTDPAARAGLAAISCDGGAISLACAADPTLKRRIRPVLDLVRAAKRKGV